MVAVAVAAVAAACGEVDVAALWWRQTQTSGDRPLLCKERRRREQNRDEDESRVMSRGGWMEDSDVGVTCSASG